MLESPEGILTDKHMDAASQLLASQFPHLQCLQSSLISQSRHGFNPVDVSCDSAPAIQILLRIGTPIALKMFILGIIHFVITAMQIMFDDAQHHWVLSTLNKDEVSIHDSLQTDTISTALKKHLVQLYSPTMACVSMLLLHSNRREYAIAVCSLSYLPFTSLLGMMLKIWPSTKRR